MTYRLDVQIERLRVDLNHTLQLLEGVTFDHRELEEALKEGCPIKAKRSLRHVKVETKETKRRLQLLAYELERQQKEAHQLHVAAYGEPEAA